MNLREAAQQVAQKATPREQLLKELMDSRVPKTEREHAAVREIERLRAALAEDAMQRLTDVQQEIEKTHTSMDNEYTPVQPVAYVTGYSKGYATVQPIDPCLLMPVGMALYRSPPTINEMETVEPVAWNKYPIDTDTTREEIFRRALDGISDYERGFIDGMQEQMRRSVDKAVNALAKRKPLTENQIRRIDDDTPFHEGPEWLVRFTRAIERAHGIGGEE